MDDKAEARFWAKVNLLGDGGCWLWTAATNQYGYGVFWLDGKLRPAHRVSWEEANGEELDRKIDLDHRRTCPKSCIRPSHLRKATRSQNNQNFSGAQVNSKSGVRGVHWDKKARRWTAQVAHEGKSYHVGYFDTIPEAENAVRLRRIELHSHNDADRATTLP